MVPVFTVPGPVVVLVFAPTYPNSSVAEPKPKLDISAVVVIVVVVDITHTTKGNLRKNTPVSALLPLPLIDQCFRSFALSLMLSVIDPPERERQRELGDCNRDHNLNYTSSLGLPRQTGWGRGRGG